MAGKVKQGQKKVWSVDHLLKCKISDFCQSSQFAIICRHTMYRTIAIPKFQDYKLTLHLSFFYLNWCASINKISRISQFFFSEFINRLFERAWDWLHFFDFNKFFFTFMVGKRSTIISWFWRIINILILHPNRIGTKYERYKQILKNKRYIKEKTIYSNF